MIESFLLTGIVAGIIAGVAILATHALFWSKPWRLSRPQAYAVGLAEIGIVYTGWLLEVGQAAAAIGFWAIVVVAGFVDMAAWWYRGRLANLLKTVDQEAFQAGIAAAPLEGDSDGSE